MVIERFTRAISNFSEVLAVRVWAKNLFIPMYGDASVLGRAISFGIRLVMLIARSFSVGIYILGIVVVLLAYFFILPISIIGFLNHLTGFLDFTL